MIHLRNFVAAICQDKILISSLFLSLKLGHLVAVGMLLFIKLDAVFVFFGLIEAAE